MNVPFPGHFVSLMQCAARLGNAPALWHFMRTMVNPDLTSDWLLWVKYACGCSREQDANGKSEGWKQAKQCEFKGRAGQRARDGAG